MPNGVLSLQRRMRRDVCDLTRGYYSDIVTIDDHDVTRQRKLPGGGAAQSFWQGREVPGVRSHVYLWTHKGVQSKADVGLSKINKHEAQLAVALAYYLVSCGVQRSSIVVLTPYKGQLMLLRKMLLTDKSNGRLLTFDSMEKDQIRLSTVDRFQGDEADIVIASLVVDENSRTPFVKLVNRMIVLLSRARLGMYVLANVGYFENRKGPHASADVKHWMNTFEMLQKPVSTSDNDETQTVVDPGGLVASASANVTSTAGTQTLAMTGALFSGSRVGAKLPLCCPQHPLSRVDVDDPQELKVGFCTVPCEVKLPCSHACGMKCHWSQKQHESHCQERLTSPCPRHPEEVKCHDVFSNTGSTSLKNATIETALQVYRCPKKVTVTLPCSHEHTLPCAVENDIIDGRASWPRCLRESPRPLCYSGCSHEKAVTCHELAQYALDPTSVPKCEESVSFHPTACKHLRKMKCHLAQAYRNDRAVYICPQRLTVELPRCGHAHKVTCAEAVELQQWQGTRCEEQDVVREGVKYGPTDLTCNEMVTFKRGCGHKVTVPCGEAFRLAQRPVPCMEQIDVSSPYCGHVCKVSCYEEKKLRRMPSREPVETVHEGLVLPLPVGLPSSMVECKTVVQLRRKCGHTQQIRCGAASRILSKCMEIVKMPSPLCAHEIDVPCYLQDDVLRWSVWSPEVLFELTTYARLPSHAKPLANVPVNEDLLVCLKSCTNHHITASRLCGHETRIGCEELLQVIRDGGEVSKGAKCLQKVEKALPCGHARELNCTKWRQIDDGIVETVLCKADKSMRCWNAAICGSDLVCVPCSTTVTAVVCCDRRITWRCAAGIHTLELPLCSKGAPTNCSKCDDDRLEAATTSAHINATTADAKALKLVPMPHSASSAAEIAVDSLQKCGKAVVLEISPEVKREVWLASVTQMLKFKKSRKGRRAPDRQTFRPQVVPIVFEITSGEIPRGFFPRKNFAKAATLGGIQVANVN